MAAHLLLLGILLFAEPRLQRPAPTEITQLLPAVELRSSPPPPRPKRVHRKLAARRQAAPAAHPDSPAPALAAIRPSTIPFIALPPALAGTAPAGAGMGPGTGGYGTGGTGSGGGGSGGSEGGTPPARISGRISDRDYPRSLSEAGVSGTVSVRYRVNTDGRVSDCVITHSSGFDSLDALTCRLIEKRFRFRPARDDDGRAVPSQIVENHSWIIPPAAQPTPDG